MYPPFWFACSSILLIYFVEPWIYQYVYNKSLMWDRRHHGWCFFACGGRLHFGVGLVCFQMAKPTKNLASPAVSETNSSMRLEDSEAITKWIEEVLSTAPDDYSAQMWSRARVQVCWKSLHRDQLPWLGPTDQKSSILNMAEHYLKYIIKKENTSSAESHTDKRNNDPGQDQWVGSPKG